MTNLRTAIQFAPKRKAASVLLAVLSLLLLGLYYGDFSAGALVCGLFLLSAFLQIPDRQPIVSFFLNGLWGCFCILLSCICASILAGAGNFLQLDRYRIVMNFICAATVYGLCLAIFGSIRSAVVTASGLLLLLTTVNGFIFQFRGTELQPMDFLSVATALNVAGQYRFHISQSMAFGWLLWLWSIFMLFTLPRPGQFPPKLWLRILSCLASVLCVAAIVIGIRPLHTSTWSNDGSTRNGYFLNFVGLIRDSRMEAPESYSAELLQTLEDQYPAQEQENQELPHILVIMNESFADFRIFSNDLNTNIDITPFMDSLQENTIRGYALTSIFGGGTANSEFEFLTGLSMGNLPAGTTPYQLYVNESTFSLAQLLNTYGYRSVSTHPYFSSGWNRTNAYPRLGFTESSFLESYPMEDLIREYVSDREFYQQILNLLDQSDAPLFLFGISMQNHGDYIYEGANYQQTVCLEGYDTDCPMAEQYLTLLHESDNAMKELITALENSDRKTIVLFFGDHFPQVEGDFFQALHGGSFDTLSEQMLQYTVPFYIWANFDIPEQEVECTSLNYLSRYLLEAAGLPLSPLHSFLKDMEQQIPAINAYGYYSRQSGTYLPFSDAEGEEAQWLENYACLQYNSLFDSENKSEVFFQNYLVSAQ